MNLRENIPLALEGLRANKMRALLTMLGIIIGISAVIAINSMGNAMTRSVLKSMQNLGGLNITVSVGARDVAGSGGAGGEGRITDAMLERFEKRYADSLSAVALSANVGSGVTQGIHPRQDLSLSGVNPGYFAVNNLSIAAGRAVTDGDLAGEKRVIVISSTVSRALYGTGASPVGRELSVETTNGTETFNIIGVYRAAGDDAAAPSPGGSSQSPAYIPLTTARALTGDAADGYTTFTLMTKSSVDAVSFSKITADFFNHAFKNTDSKVYAESMKNIMSEMNAMLTTVSTAIAVIAGISLLVGGIGVMNIMLVSVTERTREIGIRKALGAPNRAIRVQFIVESIIICTIGGVLGILLGTGLGALGGLLLKTPVTPSLAAVAGAVLFSMAIGIFFGYYPANKAAQLDPIEALRYE
jgi:putative ABC transport system permease protein